MSDSINVMQEHKSLNVEDVATSLTHDPGVMKTSTSFSDEKESADKELLKLLKPIQSLSSKMVVLKTETNLLKEEIKEKDIQLNCLRKEKLDLAVQLEALGKSLTEKEIHPMILTNDVVVLSSDEETKSPCSTFTDGDKIGVITSETDQDDGSLPNYIKSEEDEKPTSSSTDDQTKSCPKETLNQFRVDQKEVNFQSLDKKLVLLQHTVVKILKEVSRLRNLKGNSSVERQIILNPNLVNSSERVDNRFWKKVPPHPYRNTAGFDEERLQKDGIERISAKRNNLETPLIVSDDHTNVNNKDVLRMRKSYENLIERIKRDLAISEDSHISKSSPHDHISIVRKDHRLARRYNGQKYPRRDMSYVSDIKLEKAYSDAT